MASSDASASVVPASSGTDPSAVPIVESSGGGDTAEQVVEVSSGSDGPVPAAGAAPVVNVSSDGDIEEIEADARPPTPPLPVEAAEAGDSAEVSTDGVDSNGQRSGGRWDRPGRRSRPHASQEEPASVRQRVGEGERRAVAALPISFGPESVGTDFSFGGSHRSRSQPAVRSAQEGPRQRAHSDNRDIVAADQTPLAQGLSDQVVGEAEQDWQRDVTPSRGGHRGAAR